MHVINHFTNTDQLYLHGVHRIWSEGSVGQRLCWAQEVLHVIIQVSFILLNGLDAKSVFGQHSLIARRVSRRRNKLKVSMASSQEEPDPG